MSVVSRFVAALLLILILNQDGGAQVCSPTVLLKGQVDSTSLAALAGSIYAKAGATTPRQKAEAIWRFFLTDGRFVPPGFWYHIAGWAYEEPGGEVLDPMKLLNSYGFGLCYHLAPLLEAVYEAGGFEDARVWFLTGHSVTEVFYQGGYHYFDSDMMGYNPVGSGDPRKLPVASVSQISLDGNIILGKLVSPTEADTSRVDCPWYPADLRGAAIGDLAGLFTSTQDNWLFPYTRYSQGHSMDFLLRRGERLILYFEPETPDTFYLPCKHDGSTWTEFPQEIAEYAVRTEDGPRSQKDSRRWATGRLEYKPVLSSETAYYPSWRAGFNLNLLLPDPALGREYLSPRNPGRTAQAAFEIQSPYVLLDAMISLRVSLEDQTQGVSAEISVDGGRNWELMGQVNGPFHELWHTGPAVVVRSRHGAMTAVSGRYGYLMRLSMSGSRRAAPIRIRDIEIKSRFQLNPRTLPALAAGHNEVRYHPGPAYLRRSVPVRLSRLSQYAFQEAGVKCLTEEGQEVLWPEDGRSAEIIFQLEAPGGSALTGFDAGARFLDLRDGLAPDKLTAETRRSVLADRSVGKGVVTEASLAWSTSPGGRYLILWQYDPLPHLRDGKPVDRLLRWPEVDRRVSDLPGETQKVYVRYRVAGMGMDSIRLATIVSHTPGKRGTLDIIHRWESDGQTREHRERIARPEQAYEYTVDTGPAHKLANTALILSCPP
jgi:hypothetical protein